MRVRREDVLQMVIIVVLMVALALGTIGCKAQPAAWAELGGSQQEQSEQSGHQKGPIRIIRQPNREVADLGPDAMIQIMRRIGFTDEQILEYGVEMHDALFASGAVRITYKEETEALVSIKDTRVIISSLTRGTSIFDLGSGQFLTSSGGHR